MERVERVPRVIEWRRAGYVASCPQVEIASQGDTIEEARNNLQDALALFMETASLDEIAERPTPRSM